MSQLTDDQIDRVIAEMMPGVKKLLREALEREVGSTPQEDKKNRQKRRIVAALARSSDYIPANPKMEPLLKCSAMSKTMLRKAMGGNAVNIDDALEELCAEGVIKYHPANRTTGFVLQVYELLDKAQPQEPEKAAPPTPERDFEKEAAEDKRMRDIWEQAWEGYKIIPDVTLEEQLASMTPEEKRALRTGNFGPEKK